uniref:Uncharacterized protein n=1 Tax=Octopus bimaculoides TaxID=37653 RepID=A0A0L8FS74_OCTBM
MPKTGYSSQPTINHFYFISGVTNCCFEKEKNNNLRLKKKKIYERDKKQDKTVGRRKEGR